jgi:hypothetical protein
MAAEEAAETAFPSQRKKQEERKKREKKMSNSM